MNETIKTYPIYKTIGEVAKAIGLVDKKTGKTQTHTLRYWETQFKQIKPLIRAGKRRYYSEKNFKTIKLIKFLLKDRGLTISGVKKLLNSPDRQSIDQNMNFGVYKPDLKNTESVKEKLKKISNMIKELKKFK